MLRDLMRWDDALDVWSIHGMGGFYGFIALGFLADEV
jgi:ammonium transporter, Amt family